MPAAEPEALAEDSSKTTSLVRTTCEALDPGALVADLAGSDPEGSSRYEIRRVLGAGSFGKVTLAFDRVLQREVAIKQPRERLAPRARQVFVHEARLAARIRHPGIVVVHDVAVDKGELPFVVYEYVEGGSLREKLTGEAWPLPAALELALALAEGLAAAHKQGLTHRDLKPANVLLDRAGRPRIADFGLAVEAERQHTLKGEVAGTQKYMAPEQCRGDAHLVDGRTDLWALGVILYELLTGRHPFWSEGATAEEVAEQIQDRAPRPPRQWNDAIPPRVERLCLQLLAKPIAERPCSAADVADELLACLEPAEPLPAPPLAAPAKGGSLIPLLLCGAFLAAALGLGAVYLSIYGGRPAEHYPVGIWTGLLKAPPQAIIQPDGAQVEFSRDLLVVKSEYPVLLQLGETHAADYSLKVKFEESALDGDAGLFLGFGPSAKKPDPMKEYDDCLLLGAKRWDGMLKIEGRPFQQERGGLQQASAVMLPLESTEVPPPAGNGVILQIDVEGGRITRGYLDGQEIRLFSNQPYRTGGTFGIYLLQGSIRITSAAIRITQP